jgi:alkanesulfonate monooxygenase SsuD/methylene tetrahydromethanopterin reductase-like flavin-dependent oxidoreductase (luciferase family)
MARAQIAADAHDIVGYSIAATDDDPGVARALVRPALAVVGEPDWEPHVAALDIAAELAELRRSAGSAAAFAAALPDSWVDRLAVVGTARQCREQLGALYRSGLTHAVLIPAAYPDRFAGLDSLASLL